MEIDTGDTAWMLVATALVLFMTPGLALFYGGMVRAKNVLGMLMQNFFAMGLLGVLWVLLGFTLAFGNFGNGGWIGNFDYAGFKDVGQSAVQLGGEIVLPLTIPFVLFAAYQMTFAIITPALITGATADRMKFGAYALFIGIWLLVVYAPVAHWVFGGGWLAKMGALDFAGGAVVHINAGAAALGPRDPARQAEGLATRGHAPAQPDAHADRHRHPVVRVGRIQRRFRAGGERAGRAGDPEHLHRRVGGTAGMGAARVGEGRQAHDARRGVGRGGRTGRDHALRRFRRDAPGHPDRLRGRICSACWPSS